MQVEWKLTKGSGSKMWIMVHSKRSSGEVERGHMENRSGVLVSGCEVKADKERNEVKTRVE